ncbi:carbon-nitrogen hydrolase family protein [Herbivorax sp. ANBcel31]|uniref:carbon-nitrogen hydrolase family protein n=1 Tax=Herbivorax sp. ANBcel31 TaxID=3069754 RepID=UPI0027B2EEA1|nr:carbon-nitrogen hydrolase family protein [Herbivorax sp. ANBcel31]MDQ2085851.1 carbon-nitrogen hydrolase family protein [Herbivorax sp. ANBcel31]
MIVSLCQMKVEDDRKRNIDKAVKMIKTSVKNNSRIVVLPEMFCCPYDNSKFPYYAEQAEESEVLKAMSKASKEEGTYIVAGSIPELSGGKIYNSCFVFNPEGKIIGRHRKLHLFDIDIPGKITFKESDILTAGNEITVIDTEYCKVGIAICYDVRFPEMFKNMTLDGVKMVIIPAAFNMTTGPLHWELLMRARAVDNQVFVVAASPARDEKASYVAYGNSMVVSPWGKELVRAEGEETVLHCNMDLMEVEKTRKELPVLNHMRKDIY